MSEKDTTYHKVTRPENYPFDELSTEEIEHEREFQGTFATITIGALVTKVDQVEQKIAKAEQLAHDVELILAGVCLGIYLVILLHR